MDRGIGTSGTLLLFAAVTGGETAVQRHCDHVLNATSKRITVFTRWLQKEVLKKWFYLLG